MKIKNDFVTNSSSASFILTIKPNEEMNLDEFRDRFNEYIDTIKRWNPKLSSMRFWDGINIKQSNNNEFVVEEWTGMYNDIYDIPPYMSYILIADQVEDMLDWFKVVKFEIEND